MLGYGGHQYVTHGELQRVPDTTGQVDVGTVPTCDDGDGAAPARDVEVAELAGVPWRHAVR